MVIQIESIHFPDNAVIKFPRGLQTHTVDENLVSSQTVPGNRFDDLANKLCDLGLKIC